MKLSLIVPLYNEEDNIEPLCRRLREVMEQHGYDFEAILVNDGSTDATAERLDEAASGDTRFKVVNFRFNCGQTAAMMAGIDYSVGEVIITLDGDLQNDPADIPLLLAELEKGFDVCSGWRRDRQDPFLRSLTSRFANRLISRVSGIKLRDYGCTLKAYRREVIEAVRLYGEMHRFIPIYTSLCGAKITEVAVNHHPRVRGKSKYGFNRIVKVMLDLLVVKFLSGYANKPIYVFGTFGLLNMLLSVLSFLVMVYFKFWGGKSFVQTPLPMLVVLFFVIGVMAVLMGLLAEIQMRTYYESQHKPVYLVRSLRNLEKR